MFSWQPNKEALRHRKFSPTLMMDLINLDIVGGKAVDLKAACNLMPLTGSKDEEN